MCYCFHSKEIVLQLLRLYEGVKTVQKMLAVLKVETLALPM